MFTICGHNIDRSEPMHSTLPDVLDTVANMRQAIGKPEFWSYKKLAWRCLCGYINWTGDTKQIGQAIRDYETFSHLACIHNSQKR